MSITSVTDVAGLRAALDTYNGTSDDDTINVAAGTYTLSGAALDNANASGDLDITKTGGSLTIQGAGAGSTFIDANDVDRVFHIVNATSVTFADLTILGGNATDNGTVSGVATGGGILVSGAADLTLTNVTVTSNDAVGAAGSGSDSSGKDAMGGGIGLLDAGASLTLAGSTISSNTVLAGAGQAGADGAVGVNGGAGGLGGTASGGGVYSNGASLSLTENSSITGNTATGGNGGIGGNGDNASTEFPMGGNGGIGGGGGNAVGAGIFLSGGSLLVSFADAVTSNTATGGNGGNGGVAGTGGMMPAQNGDGGNGGSAHGGGVYLSGGTLQAIQSGVASSNSVTAGTAGSGDSAGSAGSASSADLGPSITPGQTRTEFVHAPGSTTQAVAADSAGNMYAVGSFSGSHDFDPGPVDAILTATGQDAFVVKYDASGALVWVKSFAGANDVCAQELAVDASGNVHVLGYFGGTADFDPGVGVSNLVSAGSDDVFAVKLDSEGDLTWARSWGGTGADRGYGIALDASGNVHTTGEFRDTVDFDPGVGTANLSMNSSDCEAFVSKLDSDGNYVWARAFQATSSAAGYRTQGAGIAVDGSGNVLTTGDVWGGADFDPGAGSYALSSSGGANRCSPYVSKLDSAGTFVWAGVFESGTYSSFSKDIAVDGSGNVIAVGDARATLDGDIGPGTQDVTGVGTGTIYVIKLSSAGAFVWGEAFGGGFNDNLASGVATDASDNIYFTGSFRGTADFDRGAGTAERTTTSYNTDAFVAKWTSAGEYVWVAQAGADDFTDHGYDVGVGADGTVIACGVIGDSAGNFAGTTISTNTTDWGYVWSIGGNGLDVSVEQAGGQADSTASSPVNFTVTFSEAVSDFATGDVTIAGTTGATTATVTGSGTTYNVAVSGMTSDGWLSVYVPAGVATNAASYPNGGSFSDDNVVVLSGGDYPPTISNTLPVDDDASAFPADNLTIAFSENVIAGTGYVSLYDSDDNLIEAVDVTGGQVTVSGDTVTIDLSSPLAEYTAYYVQIDATAFDDTTGNSFAGISDTTTWSFTTADYGTVSTIDELRAALDIYNATSTDDTITLAAGTYTLSGAALDNANVSGDLDITKTGGSLTIQGAGVGSTIIDANDVDRVLHITGATTVTLSDLTIQNGATDDDGTTSGQAVGGGILISGAADVTLDNVDVTSNTATGLAGVANGSSGAVAYGGGIAIVNAGASLTLTDTSMSANSVTGGAGHAGADGGSWTNGQTGGQGGAAGGGALYLSGGDAVLTGTSSLTGNSATGGYGGTGGRGGYTTFAGWVGAVGGAGGTASGGGAFVSGGSLSVPTSGAIISNTATGGDGGNGGPGGTSMTVGAQGNGGNGGSARGGGAYFTDGNMVAIQSGAVATNSLTAGWPGTGYLSGSNGSTSDTNVGRQASTLSVTVEQAGGQADPATSSPVEFTVTFSESVSDFATGDVMLAGTTGATTATVTGSGTTYTVAVSGLTSNGWVSAYVPAGVATNAGATPNGASSSADNVVVLSGGDFTGPTISSTTPADNATGVAVGADLEVVFNENVAKGTGNISIYDNSDTLFEAIDVTSSKVSISGDTVTINPTNSLALGTSYYVQIAATAIEDTSGNTFAGIADKTTWNFTTPDAFTDSGIALAGVGGSSVAWGDYDNDGDLDILLTGADGTVASMVSKIYRNDGGNTFTDIGASMPGLWSSSAVWGDYDNDGDLDALITGRDSSNNIILKLYRNDGSDTFTEVATPFPAVRLGSVSWGDYDNDGDLDLLLTGNDGSGNRHSEIYRNDGSDTFTDIGATLVGVYVSSVAWGDYDNDGDLDIVLTGQDADLNRITKLYRNDGSDTFTDVGASLTGMSSGSAVWGDYDNDGDLDLLLSGLDGGANKISKIYRNDGSDTFTDISASLTGVSESSGTWGDYDNDGDLDLLLAGYADGWVPVSAIYRNDGSDTFTNTNASIVDVHSPSLAWGDYDGDGDLDFLLTGFNSGGFETTRIYRNNSTIANTAPTAPTGLNVAAGSTAGEKTLSWNAATDTKTAQNGLSYNIYVGTTSGDDDVAPGMADLSGGSSDGLRRIATVGPNQGTSWTITGLAAGTYYWSVQAVDTALTGSAWATEGSFTVDTTAPLIDSTVPADDATDVDPTADLSITLDENVVKGTGNISIYDSSDTLFEAIDVTSGQVTVSGANGDDQPDGFTGRPNQLLCADRCHGDRRHIGQLVRRNRRHNYLVVHDGRHDGSDDQQHHARG